MKRLLFATFLLILIQLLTQCKSNKNMVVVETEYGNIIIQLYEETPIHRDNFLTLAEEGYYDGLLFHRVIHEFMIQGGDPESREASSGTRLGSGGPDYKLDSEIIYPQFFHKKGALAAARQGDQVNPEKQSSGSQFYLVHGKVYTHEELDRIEQMKSDRQRQQIFMKFAEPYRNELTQMQQTGDREGFQELLQKIEEEATPEMEEMATFKFPEEHREAYTTIGGAPQLDGEYTVFGEVVDGLEIIDIIAEIEVNDADRPLKDLEMNIRTGKK